jgi:NAD(P)-dependent dehydrogenase (short-subunit alcohol dehydrogenase family)
MKDEPLVRTLKQSESSDRKRRTNSGCYAYTLKRFELRNLSALRTIQRRGTMQGKTVLITGANQGIGKATAVALAQQGARVAIVARGAEKGRSAAADIERASGSKGVGVIVADLSSLKEVRRAAAEFRSRYARLDVLVNNAGVFVPKRHVTIDGFEETFAVNHLSNFLLTRELLDVLKASAPARIVNVSSDAHRRAEMQWDDLEFANHHYSAWRAYAQSKLANVLFTYELARRLEGTRVTANSLHPGVVASGFGRTYRGPMALLFMIGAPFMLSCEEGAATSVYLASSPEVEGVSGKYFARRKQEKSSAISYCLASQRKLWALSEEAIRRTHVEPRDVARFSPALTMGPRG